MMMATTTCYFVYITWSTIVYETSGTSKIDVASSNEERFEMKRSLIRFNAIELLRRDVMQYVKL